MTGSSHAGLGHTGASTHFTVAGMALLLNLDHASGVPHFTLTSNNNQVAGHTVMNDAAIDSQGSSSRVYVTGTIPTKDADGNLIGDFIVHVVNHGTFNVLQLIRELAAQLDLVQLDTLRPNMDSLNKLEPKILDWDAWSEFPDGVKPAGYYAHANGTTTLLRTYWQVGVRKGFKQPAFDPKAHTYLEISAVIWKYFETQDSETCFRVRVIYTPECPDTVNWGYRRIPFENHQRAAIIICEKVLAGLRSCKPSDVSKQFRAMVTPTKNPITTDPEGAHPASQTEVEEMELDDVERAADQDYDTALDFENGTVGPNSPTPSDDSDDEISTVDVDD